MSTSKPDVYTVWITEQVSHRYFVIANSESEAKEVARVNHANGKDQNNAVWVSTHGNDGIANITADPTSDWYTDGGGEIDPDWENEPAPNRLHADYDHACRRGTADIWIDRSSFTVIDVNGKEWSAEEMLY